VESSTSNGNSFVKSTENSQNNEQQGLRYVRIAGEGETEAYVREDYAELAQVRAVEPTEEGHRYVRGAFQEITAVETEPVYYVGFVGTTGLAGMATVHAGVRFLELRQYVRPTKDYVPAVLRALNFTQELTNRGIPWVAVVTAHVPGRKNKPKVLILKSVRQYAQRYHVKSGETRVRQELVMYFVQHVFGGFSKRKKYFFELTILVPKRQPIAQPAGVQVSPIVRQINPGEPSTNYVSEVAGQGKPKKDKELTQWLNAEPEANNAQAQPSGQAQPNEKETYQRVASQLTGSNLTAEDIERQIKQLRESLKKIKELQGL
jgi:hypothetical protein